jgi:hypothetical protein
LSAVLAELVQTSFVQVMGLVDRRLAFGGEFPHDLSELLVGESGGGLRWWSLLEPVEDRQPAPVELVDQRACVEALAAAAPDWVAARLDAGWQRRYGARVDSWRCPPPRPSGPRWVATTPVPGWRCCA